MKKSWLILVVLLVLPIVFCCGEAEILRNPLCDECGRPMRAIVYTADDDAQYGTYTESRSHLDHTDFRYVSRFTKAYECQECGVIEPYGKTYVYSDWFCDYYR